MNIHIGKKILTLLMIFTMLFTWSPAISLASQNDAEISETTSEALTASEGAEVTKSNTEAEDAAEAAESNPAAEDAVEIIETNPAAGDIAEDIEPNSAAKDAAATSGSVSNDNITEENSKSASYSLHWNSSLADIEGNVLNGTDLEMTPVNNSVQNAKLQINFTLGGDQPAAPGEIEIRIPLSIFSGRDGNAVDTIHIPLAQAPEEAGLTSFNYYIDGDEVVITNYAAVSGAAYFTCDIEYTFLPSDIADGYINSDIKADFIIALEGQEEIKYTSDVLTVEVNTDATISSLVKRYVNKYETWQWQWGQAPADAADYFYIMWQSTYTAPANCTQPYTVDFEDNTGGQGVLVGSSSASSGSGLTDGTLTSINVEVPATSSSTYTQYILIKYPRTLLEDEDTLTITNEVTANLTGVDSASDTKTATAEYLYQPVNPDYPGDSYSLWKSAYGSNVGIINAIENDQAKKLGAGSESSFGISTITRAWGLTEDGTEPVTVDLIDDLLFIGTEQLQPEDYNITSCYVTFTEYDHVVNPDTGYTAVISYDYTSYSPLNVYYKTTGSSNWQLAGEVVRTAYDSYIFTDTAGNTMPCNADSQIPLPDGAYAVKFSHTSSRYQVQIAGNFNVTLNPTQHVKDLLADRDSAILYNVNSLYAKDSEGNIQSGSSVSGIAYGIRDQVIAHSENEYGQVVRHVQAYTTLTRLDAQTKITKTAGSIASDVVNGQEVLDYKIDVFEEAAYAPEIISLEEVKDLGIVKEQTEGVFYDLLPAGTVADPSTISVTTYGSNIACSFTVDMVQNWQNSGQTMMIIYVTAPTGTPNYYSYAGTSSSFLTSGFTLTFKMIYTWENIHDYGQTALNSVAYRSSTGILSSGETASESGITKYEFFKDLNNDGVADDTDQNTVYTENSTVFSPLEAAELGFSKAVKAADELTYGEMSEVPASGTYTYRLRFANAKDVTSSGLVMYDILESYDSGDSMQWKGTLESVNTAFAESKGITPVVYYSTSEGLKLEEPGAGDADLTNTSIWQTDAPEDLGSVTAVAIDMSKKTDGSPYVLVPEEVVLCYIAMRAPANYQDYIDPVVYAYNDAFAQVTYQTIGGDPITSISECNYTQVSLRAPDIFIKKSSDPESGTEKLPASVNYDDTIDYTVSITNTNSSEAMEGVEITDIIPEGLIIDMDHIMYYFGSDPDNADIISASERVSVTADGQKLVFVIDRLTADETVNFIIPTTVSNDVIAQKVIENTATITKINGSDYNINSNTTYHIITKSILNLTAAKNLTGKPLEDGMFSFIVQDENGDVVATATNKANGTIVFGDIAFQDVGTYVFTVSEINGGSSGIIYDDTEYTVAVEVIDNGDGTLTATPVYPSGGIVFNNRYINEDITVSLTGTKKLTGKTLKDHMFSFSVKDENGDVVATATNKADGRIVFGEFSFAAAGTYTYSVSEINGGLSGIIYDNTEHIVKVEVIENDEGTLTATVIYPDGGIVFNNVYSSGKGSSTGSGTGLGTSSGRPATGDITNLKLFLMLFAGSLSILVCIGIRKRRANKLF